MLPQLLPGRTQLPVTLNVALEPEHSPLSSYSLWDTEWEGWPDQPCWETRDTPAADTCSYPYPVCAFLTVDPFKNVTVITSVCWLSNRQQGSVTLNTKCELHSNFTWSPLKQAFTWNYKLLTKERDYGTTNYLYCGSCFSRALIGSITERRSRD